MILRRHDDELDTTIKNQQGKIAQLENDVHTRNGEVDKLNTLNTQLQKEKQDILKLEIMLY